MDEGQPETTLLDEGGHLSVGELALRAGVSRRTVRFYVQRGLLAPPLGGGRGSYYTEAHLTRLLAVKQLQERGLPLEVVQQRLEQPPESARPDALAGSGEPRAHAPSSSTSPEGGETWRRYALVPGVELLARDGVLSAQQLAAIVATTRALVSNEPPPEPVRPRGPGAQRAPRERAPPPLEPDD